MQTREDFYTQLHALQQRFDAMEPEQEITLKDPTVGLEGYVVIWNTAIARNGPLPNCAKGGTRIRKGLTINEVRMLAKNMALKNAAAGLPLGGCKSGINADSSVPEFEKKYRRFVQLCQPFTHENGGSFGGFGFDIGAAPEHAYWACDTLNSTQSFTGKPLALGGTDYDREGIAGLGVAQCASELLHLKNNVFSNTTYTVHGIGAMGTAVIRYFSETGAQLKAIGDPKFGGVWSFPKPASSRLLTAFSNNDIEAAKTYLSKEAKKISDDANDVLYIPCDVLFPCALQHAIHGNNAQRIHAKIIVEGANNPTTLEAYELLHQQGITHIPDFMANYGGVIAAFVELTSQVSNEENLKTKAKVHEAKTLTLKTAKRNIQHILSLSSQYNTSLRDAGLFIAYSTLLQDVGR